MPHRVPSEAEEALQMRKDKRILWYCGNPPHPQAPLPVGARGAEIALDFNFLTASLPLKGDFLGVEMTPRNELFQRSRFSKVTLGLGSILLCLAFGLPTLAENDAPQFFDLSLLVSPDLPTTWPGGFPYFQINHYLRLGP